MPQLRVVLVHLSPRAATRAGVAALGLASLAIYMLDLHALFGRELRVLGVYVAIFGLVFGLYLLASWLALHRGREDRVVLGLILGFGLLFRVAGLAAPVVLSSDVYRYLWDGRVQWAGINPYRYAPTDEPLRPLRDTAIHPNLNRPDKRTVYPAGAQLMFALVAGVAPSSLTAWRLWLLACEVATIVLLLRLLRRLGRPAAAVILYAWAPLAVFEGVHAGHLDAALLPAVLLALNWRLDGRMLRAGMALGMAVALKLYPAVLLVWWRRREWRLPTACVAVVALAYLPYSLDVGAGALGFLPEYVGRAEDFNVGLRFFVTEAIGATGEVSRTLAMVGLSAALLIVLLVIRGRLVEPADGVVRAGRAAVGAYLVLIPTALHPWYAVWILPFVALTPSPAWLWFTGAVSLSYLAYVWLPAEFPLWARLLEFVPLYALLVWEALGGISWTRGVARAETAGAGLSSPAASPPAGPPR